MVAHKEDECPESEEARRNGHSCNLRNSLVFFGYGVLSN